MSYNSAFRRAKNFAKKHNIPATEVIVLIDQCMKDVESSASFDRREDSKPVQKLNTAFAGGDDGEPPRTRSDQR